jgi:oxygen-independent coproporphyrinogen-3 oxidase
MSALALYVHIPFCRRRCPYCSFYHVRPRDEGAFSEAMATEASDSLASFSPPARLGSVYFGGGTPSVLSRSSWQRVFDAIAPYLAEPAAPREITCEVNPEDVTEGRLDDIASLGVNRISLGIQSMDPDAQRLLGRCTPEVNRRAIDAVVSRFDNVSFDVLLGVPGRDRASLGRTIDELIGRGPAHFSVYCLEEGGDMAGQAREFFSAVDPDHAAEEYLDVCARLRAAGYRHYEVSNFARPGLESSHNRTYWDGGDYLGLGPAAHSLVGGRRFHNPPSLELYLAGAGRPASERWIFDDVDPQQRRIERVMLSLRTDRGVPLEALSCPQHAIDGILGKSLAEVAGGRLRLTDRGFLLLNEIILRLAEGA